MSDGGILGFHKLSHGSFLQCPFKNLVPAELYEETPYEDFFEVARDLKINVKELGIKGKLKGI